MAATSFLASLASPQTWITLGAALVFGIAGGLAHYAVRDPNDPDTKPSKAIIVGLVAALGALWVSPPDTPLAMIGQPLLVGFFGRAVLASLQARVVAAVQKERAMAVARDSLALAARRSDTERAAAPPPEVAALRARLAELQPDGNAH